MALPLQLPWEQSRTLWAQELQQLLTFAIGKGTACTDVDFTGGQDKVINHGLNRTPQGWFVIDKQGNADIWRTVAFNNQTITLRSSANVTASIWVY